MYRFGSIHFLQDIVRLSLTRPLCLNLEQVGAGFGHQPADKHSNENKKEDGGTTESKIKVKLRLKVFFRHEFLSSSCIGFTCVSVCV